jgi:hypothetical protein
MTVADNEPGAAPSGAGAKSPDEIRAEIEDTRQQLGDTVEELAARTDVKARAKDRLDVTRRRIARISGEAATRAKASTPESAGAGAHQVAAVIAAKPVPFATAGAFTTGVFIGWLVARR